MNWLDEVDVKAGAKAYNLSRLRRAGLQVADGFCLLHNSFLKAEGSIKEGLQAWQERFAGQALAVRSSGALEDGLEQSLAGQFVTVLNVADDASFIGAIERVAASIQGGSVLVQPMILAQVAGVVFTQDPTITKPAVRIEATPGLGEVLVSGRVQPSAWRVCDDEIMLLQGTACLSQTQIWRLLQSCQRAQEILGGELDVEFVFSQAEDPWIVQARPITTLSMTLEQLCQQERQLAASRTEPAGSIWSRSGVAETLPHPLPMTWAIVSRMLSLRGAYGKMYRDMGYDPDPKLQDLGVADLICGRPYINLNRESRVYFQYFPFTYSWARLKADPLQALAPVAEVDLQRAPPGFWRHLPATIWKMLRSQQKINRLRHHFEHELRQHIAPRFMTDIEAWREQVLETMSLEDLRKHLEEVTHRVVDDFAGDSLKASALAVMLAGQSKPVGVSLDREADVVALMRQGAGGQLSLEQLIELIGHRGPGEMELANPRWYEIPEALQAELGRVALVVKATEVKPNQPEHAWIRLREMARHWLMLGWAEIRRILLALDMKLGLQGGIFWLTPEELSAPDLQVILWRQRRHRMLQAIPCPPVIFSDDLQAIGRQPQSLEGKEILGIGLSPGIMEGVALRLQAPQSALDRTDEFVLVCPTTDPAFMAAMSRACALVVEVGGVLSHGAIIARELGLPAVSGIDMTIIKAGQRLRVDGSRGVVTLLD